MKSTNTARDDRINTRIFPPNIPETPLLHGGASVLIKIKIAALDSRYAWRKRDQVFLMSWDGTMTRGDKLALVGVTVGWLLAGGLMTWAIYAFMVYVLKYW